MKNLILIILVLLSFGATMYPTNYGGCVTTTSRLLSVNQGNTNFDILDGKAEILSKDGQFLGIVSSNKYNAQSILNKYGQHGSAYSAVSIFNKYGTYGSKYSGKSAFNKYAVSPPMIFINKKFIAYLTTNQNKHPRINPYSLIRYLGSK